MKNVLNEISRIKSLMSINEQFEDENNDQESGTVIIGDNFAELVSNDINTIKYLVDSDMTVNLLMKRLSSSEVYENVTNLILSIGTVDFFKGLNSISVLCDMIYEVFPNANFYVFKGVISDFDIQDEKEMEEIEESSNIFYDEFEVCGFEIIGDYSVISDVTIDFVNPAIQNLVEFANEIELIGSESKTTLSKPTTAKKSINDDETDFDSIYEFLEQFEKIYKSKKSYDQTLGGEFEFDIMQIQIVLNFLTGTNLEVNGEYDDKTENAVANFQEEMDLPETGICDTETLEEMFYKLKVKGFDEDDLSKFLKGQNIEGETILGILNISRAGLDSEQKSNVDLLIKYMEDAGITNVYAKVGILSVIGKESGFVPKNEICYDGTDNSRIMSIFGNCRLNPEKLQDEYGMTLSQLKMDCEKFFDAVYGPNATSCLGWSTGNDNPGDGYKYRGRGFNQITFKHNYQKYGDAVGMDLVSDPDQLNDVDVAAEAAIKFLTKGRTNFDFKDKEEATNYFLNVNAGGSNGRTESRQKAFEWMNKFEVK